MKSIVLLIFLISIKSIAQTGDIDFPVNVKSTNEKSLSISLIQLISNPEKYHGKVVSVAGYLNLQFEETALYIGEEDEEHRLQKNAVWIDKQSDRASIYHKEYVIVTGIYDMNKNGHFGSFTGTITKIENIYKL